MKLFGNFEAVSFYEENMIFVTKGGYLYYIYSHTSKRWQKHRNAGNDHITVCNYSDVRKSELTEAMGGIFPKKETDFMRLCDPAHLWVADMLSLLTEDYSRYMSDRLIYDAVWSFLLEADVKRKSFLMLKALLDSAVSQYRENKQVLDDIKELCFAVIGRDIFKREIGIVDGHDSSSYFWIKPVRVIDYTNTNDIDNVAEMESAEISIEEDDVSQYLAPFLYKYFDGGLEANKNRVDGYCRDDEDEEQAPVLSGFEWYLTHNFYTYDSVNNVLKDISETIDALSSGAKNEYTVELIKRRNTADCKLIIDFYRRFIYRMEYMMKVGKEKGYDLISFMGP